MSFGGSLKGKSCLDVVSNLFNDTTRIRIQQQNRRPSLANMFSHEAPSLGEGRRIRFISALPRPTEPPPPPPPVTEILRPVVPPRKFHPFTQDEVEKINNVINGSRAASTAGDDSSDDVDCFSTDEFSDDEFDSMEPPNYAPPAKPADALENDDLYDVAEFSEAAAGKEEALNREDIEAMDLSNTSSSSDPGSTPDESGEDASSNSSREDNSTTSADRQQPRIIGMVNSSSSSNMNSNHSSDNSSSLSTTTIQCSSNLNDNSPLLRRERGEDSEQQQQKHQILISSSSWINVQVDPSKFVTNSSNSPASSVINVPYMLDSSDNGSTIPEEDTETEYEAAASMRSSNSSSGGQDEPVKPPRLKKLARLQKQQIQLLHKTRSEEDIMLKKKISASFDNLRVSSSTRNLSSGGGKYGRPEISAPVLLATTLNPNDTEAHKSLSNVIPPQPSSSTMVPATMIPTHRKSLPSSSADGEKLSFKELKRLSSFFPSLSSLSGGSSSKQNSSSSSDSSTAQSLSNPLNRSSFYVAEAIYEEASGSRQASPSSEHIYEEIPDRKKGSSSSRLASSTQRPLPPIPQSKAGSSSGRKIRQSSGTKKRTGSIFEGASKYEILHYLKDAKNRIGHGDFEIDLESDRDEGFDNHHGGPSVNGFLGKRNHTHRVSAISTASDSSNCSVESTGSSTMSSGDGSVLLSGPAERFQVQTLVGIIC